MVEGYMAENDTSSPKVEENLSAPNATDASEAEAELISLEDMEALIAEKDPEFVKQMEAFNPESGAEDLNIELVDLDQYMADEKAMSNQGRVRHFLTKSRSRIIIFSTVLSAYLLLLFKEGLPENFRKLKNSLSSFSHSISQGLRRFSFWPARKKMATFGLIFGVLATVGFVFFAATKPLLTTGTDLFILSLEDSADSVHTYDPEKDAEPFYDSPRASQNIMTLQKVVVNIKSGTQSGPNPMGAFEFYVEGNSPDVMVEVKDREYEVKDLFQRNIEEMSFNQLETAEGKQLLLEKLRREVNRILTKGRVRKVMFKTVILKP